MCSYGCLYGAKFKLLYSEKISFYSEKHFHIQRKFYYLQRNTFIFRVIFLYLKKFSTFREIAYLKKLFIFSIQIKFLYYRHVFYPKKMLILKKIGTLRENLNSNFKLSIIVGFSHAYLISTKKIEAIIKGKLTWLYDDCIKWKTFWKINGYILCRP